MTETTAQAQETNSRAAFPPLLSHKHLQACGMTRSMAYALLNREDMPVVRIGERLFMNRDLFFEWLDEQARSGREALHMAAWRQWFITPWRRLPPRCLTGRSPAMVGLRWRI